MKVENIDKIGLELIKDKVNWTRVGQFKFRQLLETLNDEIEVEIKKKKKTLDLNSDLLKGYDKDTRSEIEALLNEDNDLLLEEQEVNYTAQVNDYDPFTED